MNRKTYAVAALVVAGAALSYIAFGNLGENIVYYWSPAEMAAAGDKAYGATIRLGGLVEAGTVQKDGSNLKFKVTDGTASVMVATSAIPPAMFREGIGVVVEGTLQESGVFTSERLLVKHDNQYRAPGTGEPMDKEQMFGTLAADATGTTEGSPSPGTSTASATP